MRTVIQAIGVELDPEPRRFLESQLMRDLARFAKDVDVATAYVSAGSEGTPYIRVSVLAKDGKRHSAEGKSATHLQALAQASSQVCAALQREQARRNDPRLHRPGAERRPT